MKASVRRCRSIDNVLEPQAMQLFTSMFVLKRFSVQLEVEGVKVQLQVPGQSVQVENLN